MKSENIRMIIICKRRNGVFSGLQMANKKLRTGKVVRAARNMEGWKVWKSDEAPVVEFQMQSEETDAGSRSDGAVNTFDGLLNGCVICKQVAIGDNDAISAHVDDKLKTVGIRYETKRFTFNGRT